MKTVTLHLTDAQHARLVAVANLLNCDVESLVTAQAFAHVDMWGPAAADLVNAFDEAHSKYVVQGLAGDDAHCSTSVAFRALEKEVRKRGGFPTRPRSLEAAETSIDVPMTLAQATPVLELAKNLRATPGEMLRALALAMLAMEADEPLQEYSRALLDFGPGARVAAGPGGSLWKIGGLGEVPCKERPRSAA